MGMTKVKAVEVLNLESLNAASTTAIEDAYKREALWCHPDNIIYPENANEVQKKELLIQSQKRFMKITLALKVLKNEIKEEPENTSGLTEYRKGPKQSPFWLYDLNFKDESEIENVYKKLFLEKLNTFSTRELSPYLISWSCKEYNTTTGSCSFSTQQQLIDYCIRLKKLKGEVTFHILNFPREWLGNVQNLLRLSDNLTGIQFPAGYCINQGEWTPLVKRHYLPPAKKFSLKALSKIYQKNKYPIIGGLGVFVSALLFLGGYVLPILLALGVGFTTKAIKMLKESKAKYTADKIENLGATGEGKSEVEAFHCGERVFQGYRPFWHAITDDKIRKDTKHFEAFLAGAQIGWSELSFNKPKRK